MATENVGAGSWQSWIARVEGAVGERIGSAESRRAFAEALLRGLAPVLPQAAHAEARVETTERLAKVAVRARDAVRMLRRALGTKTGAVLDIGVWPEDLETTDAFLSELARKAERNAQMALALRPSRRGRPVPVLGIHVAEFIAALYWQHLGEAPKHRKQRAHNEPRLPFDRVCDVVVAVQRGRISISDTARAHAIRKRAP